MGFRCLECSRVPLLPSVTLQPDFKTLPRKSSESSEAPIDWNRMTVKTHKDKPCSQEPNTPSDDSGLLDTLPPGHKRLPEGTREESQNVESSGPPGGVQFDRHLTLSRQFLATQVPLNGGRLDSVPDTHGSKGTCVEGGRADVRPTCVETRSHWARTLYGLTLKRHTFIVTVLTSLPHYHHHHPLQSSSLTSVSSVNASWVGEWGTVSDETCEVHTYPLNKLELVWDTHPPDPTYEDIRCKESPPLTPCLSHSSTTSRVSNM